MKSQITPYNRPHHLFATFVACFTFLLIIAGALVTSNDAGLAVPDWPTSFGSFHMPRMVGGVLYEHGHRMIAGLTTMLTVALALWTWLVDRRAWMRKLAWAALGTIVLQATLGGLTVLNFLPPAVSTAHALVGQTFFCIAVVISLLTARRYVEQEPEKRVDSGHPRLFTLALLSIGILYLQLALGGMFRHHGMGWQPHVINAIVVVAILTWTAVRTLTRYSTVPVLRRSAVLMLVIMLAQLGLGFLSFLTKVVEGADAAQPTAPMVWSTVSHVAVGALLLVSAFVMAIQAHRHLRAPSEQWARAEGAERIRHLASANAASGEAAQPGAMA